MQHTRYKLGCERCGKEFHTSTHPKARFCSYHCSNIGKRTVHGEYGTRLYRIYRNIQSRVYNKNTPAYKDYGGRGIQCLWPTFEDFKRDMGNPPSDNHSIERQDNAGHYCKENCYWATPKEQARNRRSNRYITFNGKNQIVDDWGKETGFGREVIEARLDKLNWSIKKTLTTPVKGRG